MKSDVSASTHKERKMPKVVSHLEIHPNMKGGHDVHIVHTHQFDHPTIVKSFPGPHAAVNLEDGHVLHHIAKHMSIPTTGESAGSEEPQEEKEAAQI